MQRADTPATLVICATIPAAVGASRRGEWTGTTGSTVPVTWIASWDALAAVGIPGGNGTDVALEIPAAALGSRQRMRTLLARGRDAFPTLDTVALHGDADRDQRSFLVDEGIRAVLVDQLSADGRGSRRPPPRGWRCRNAAWGLWDIELSATAARGPLAWLWQGMLRLRRGGLHVLKTEGLMVGSGGRVFVHPRLERWLAWAGRQVDRGVARTETVGGLVAGLSGEDRLSLGRSILRAA